MEEKYNKTNAFCYELFDVSELDIEPFEDLYWWYFKDCSKFLTDEIITNVSTLSPKQFTAYSKHVEYEIREAYPDNPDESYVDKWIEELGLSLEDYPFFDNPEIDKYTSKIWNTYDGEVEQRKAHLLQRDFFFYASLLEARKILKLLNDLTPNLQSKSVDHSMFIPESGLQIFSRLLDFLNVKDATTRGNQAKLAAIWQTEDSNKVIFKASTTKKQYLVYLNSIYGSNFTTKSFSDGSNYERTIEKWILEQNV